MARQETKEGRLLSDLVRSLSANIIPCQWIPKLIRLDCLETYDLQKRCQRWSCYFQLVSFQASVRGTWVEDGRGGARKETCPEVKLRLPRLFVFFVEALTAKTDALFMGPKGGERLWPKWK